MDKVRSSDLERDGGEDSGLSNVSTLDNETDDFGRKILQHQKDQLRLKNAIQNTVSFRKPRPIPWNPGTHQRSQSCREDVFANQGQESPGSEGSNDSEPPLNIPREWGRKRRQLPDWARNRNSTGEGSGSRTPNKDEDAIILRKTSYTGDDSPKFKRYASHEGILPSVETTPPLTDRRGRTDVTPSSMHHMNTTMHHDLDAEDHDFTAESLLASTPAVNNRNHKIDEFTGRDAAPLERKGIAKRDHDFTAVNNRNRKIDEFTDRDIATLGWKGITKRDHDFTAVNNRNRKIDEFIGRDIATLERKGITKRELEKIASNRDGSRPSSAPSSDLAGVLQQTDDCKLDKENLRPNGSPPAERGKRLGLPDFASVPVTIKSGHGPDHRRADSINLLRKLARVSSMSPSPDSGPDRLRTGASQDRRAGRWQSSVGAPPEPTVPVDTNRDMADFLAGLPLQPASSDRTQTETADVKEGKSERANVVKDEREGDDEVRRIPSGPDRHKSALADILAKAMNQPNGPFGEATINSLDDIVNPDLDPTDSINIDELPVGIGFEHGANGATASQSERAQLESMGKNLRKASTSIQDVDRGLRRAENRFEMVKSTQTTSDNSATRFTTQPVSESQFPPSQKARRSDNVCPHCGSIKGSVWFALWAELRGLFCYFEKGDSWLSVRPTRFGWICSIWLAWYLAESIACSFYCHPLYATSMVGFGVDPDAPDFPFVIPTLLFRPFKWLWGPVIDQLAWCLGGLLQHLLGDSASSDDSFYLASAS